MPIDSTLGHAPKYTVTVGARTPVVGGLKFGSIINGGHHRLEGFISNTERTTGGSNYNAWTTMSVEIAAGETGAGTVVWDGYVARTVQPSPDNKCRLYGVGAAEIARTTYKTLLFRVDDLSLWQARDSDDANFPANYRHISAEVDGRPLFHADAGAYGVNNIGGLACVLEDVGITKITFRNNKGTLSATQATAANSFAWVNRAFAPPLLNGDSNNAVQVGVNANVGNIAQGAVVTRTVTGTQRAAITLELMCTQAITLSETSVLNIAAAKPKVYGLATSDTYYASDVVTYVGGTTLGWNTTLVQPTTTLILPVYFKRSSPLADLLDQMCDADQMFWRVKNRSAGVFQLEFSSWTHAASVPWHVSVADPAVGKYEIEGSDDLVNAVKVHYKSVTGRPLKYTVYADGLEGRPQDPFTGTVRSRTNKPVFLDYDIDDPQPDNTYPIAVANGLIKEYAVQQYEGTVELASAHQTTLAGTEKYASQSMAGDKLVIADGVQPGTYRITEAEHSDSGVTRLTIGRRPGDFLALQAKHLKKLERKGLR